MTEASFLLHTVVPDVVITFFQIANSRKARKIHKQFWLNVVVLRGNYLRLVLRYKSFYKMLIASTKKRKELKLCFTFLKDWFIATHSPA